MTVVKTRRLEKTYQAGNLAIKAIRGVDFSIEPASFVAFIGPSGSGKSALLNMIGCLDPPTGYAYGGPLSLPGQRMRPGHPAPGRQ